MTPAQLEEALRLVLDRRGLLRDLVAVDRAEVTLSIPSERQYDNPRGNPRTIKAPGGVIREMRAFARAGFQERLTEVETKLRDLGVDFSNDPPLDPQGGPKRPTSCRAENWV